MVDIEKVKKLAEKEFVRKIPEVIGVSAHHSKPVLRIYVEKLDSSVLKELPKMFLGYEVQVIEVGKVRTLINRRARHRPLFPGISIGSEIITAGTLSQICIDNTTQEYCLLSNRHVFWGDEGTRVLQPGSYDGGKVPDDTVGYILRYEEIKPDGNLIDAAISSLEVKATNRDPKLGQPMDIGEVEEGEIVFKVGRTTGLTRAKVLDTSAVIKVCGYQNVGEAIFNDVIITTVFSAGGDSGSPVFDTKGRLIGLVFAGSNRITVICKIKHVINALDITPIYGRFIQAGMPNILGLALIPVATYIASRWFK